jgi:hypothetical protein
MGDRAIVVFKSVNKYSPCVYVHWDGSEIPSYLIKAAPSMRKGDESYACARFIGYLNGMIEGPRSLGVYNFSGSVESEDPGDAGVFIVDVDTGEVTNYGGYALDPSLDSFVLKFAEE